MYDVAPNSRVALARSLRPSATPGPGCCGFWSRSSAGSTGQTPTSFSPDVRRHPAPGLLPTRSDWIAAPRPPAARGQPAGENGVALALRPCGGSSPRLPGTATPTRSSLAMDGAQDTSRAVPTVDIGLRLRSPMASSGSRTRHSAPAESGSRDCPAVAWATSARRQEQVTDGADLRSRLDRPSSWRWSASVARLSCGNRR